MQEVSVFHPGFVDHVVFRVSNLDRTESFYNTLLGQPSQRSEQIVMYTVGETRVFFSRATEDPAAVYDKEKVGLNHLAFGVSQLAELETIKQQLDSSGIPNSGVKIDRYGLKEYIWLDDPDGLRVEFYLRPEQQ